MEPLLQPEEARLNLLPIRHPDLWHKYKEAFAAFWTPGEVDLSKDPDDWKTLAVEEKHFLSYVLAFFSQADGIVTDNLADRFSSEVQYREAKCFYGFQMAMENVHNEMYSLLIESLIPDASERDKLLHAIEHIPCVAKKARWAQRWMTSSESFATRLIAFAVVEGIFFSGSFCSIFWIKQRGILPGLCASNTLIARDEGMHQRFATTLYRDHVRSKLPVETVHEIVRDAVAHEVEFCCEALPVSMIGMNAEDMAEYIRFVADRLLSELDVPMLYHAKCPFDFMKTLGAHLKTNFFEERVTEYQKVGAVINATDSYVFDTDADF